MTANYFLNIFRNNQVLTVEDRKKLMVQLSDFLVFDGLFTQNNLSTADFKSVLQKYGWFWLSLDADPESGKKPQAFVVNDVSDGVDNSAAQVKYYDVADGTIKEVNFTDFVNQVRSSVLSEEQLAYAVIRLKNPASGEGKADDLRFMDLHTRHALYVDAIDQILERFKDHPTFVKAGYGYVKDKNGKNKLQLLLRFKDELPMELGDIYQYYSGKLDKQFALAWDKALDSDDAIWVDDTDTIECVHKPSAETRINTAKSTLPVLGGTLLSNTANGNAGTFGAWFRDKTTNKPVMLTNQHVVKDTGVRLAMVNYKVDTDQLTFGPVAFTSSRLGMEKTANVKSEKDMAIATPLEDKYIPEDLVTNGNKFTWNEKTFFAKGWREPIVGEKVFKIGAASGYTEGEIGTYFKRLLDMSLPENAGKWNYVVEFKMQNDAGVIAHGDSGSVVISADKSVLTSKHEFIGLIYAAENPLVPELDCLSRSAYALGIDYVCSQMNIEVF